MREYLLVLLVAAGVTYLLGSLARRLAFRFNMVSMGTRSRDINPQPVARLGGMAMLAGLAASVLMAFNLPWLGSFELVRHDTLGVLLAAVVICAVGVADDRFEISAVTKIAGQVLAAGIAVINGVKVYWIPLPNAVVSIDEGTSIIITVVLIFVAANAVNLIDGLDGLAAGVVAIGASSFFGYAYLLSYGQGLERATTSSLITASIVGICLGFLPHNIHPARIFMGDSGSMLLGFLMAASLISLTGQLDPSLLSRPGMSAWAAYLPLILPLAVMALPLVDLCWAYLRRIIRGESPFQADKQHLHHRILNLGHGHFRGVSILWLWSVVLAFGVLVVGLYPGIWSFVGTGVGIVVAAAFTWGFRLVDKVRSRG